MATKIEGYQIEDNAISENHLSLNDNTIGDASTSKHGWLKKLLGDSAKFLNSVGDWVTLGITDIFNLQTALNNKQDTLVSGTNIKTINSNSIVGSGDVVISGLTVYSPSLANCENTTNETSLISFTIPGGTWIDGKTLQIIVVNKEKQNSGAAVNMQNWFLINDVKYWGGNSQSVANGTTEYIVLRAIFATRIGNDLLISPNSTFPNGNAMHASGTTTNVVYDDKSQTGTANYIFTSGGASAVNFNNDITIKINRKYASANSLIYCRPQSAQVLLY